MDAILSYVQGGAGLLLQLAGLVVLALLGRAGSTVQAFLRARTERDRRVLLGQLGREAYAFAETIYHHKDSASKRDEAMRYLLDKCDACGIRNLQMADARAALEMAWLEDRRRQGLPVGKQVPAQMSPSEWR